jgi:ABC-type nitrate/sulfonate/bicarbonate transport system permease component
MLMIRVMTGRNKTAAIIFNDLFRSSISIPFSAFIAFLIIFVHVHDWVTINVFDSFLFLFFPIFRITYSGADTLAFNVLDSKKLEHYLSSFGK